MCDTKRILVTGGTGMVGSNVIGTLGGIEGCQLLHPTRKELDLLKEERVVEYLKEYAPDIIIHCAGKVGGISANMNNKLGFLYENAEISKNLIIAAYQNEIKEFINLGSSCFYPKNLDRPIKESDLLSAPLEPTNEGYSIAKIYALKLCQYIDQSADFNYKTIIPCNLYGKGDDFSAETGHMIPEVMKRVHDAKVSEKESITMWGDGTARREFMYVGELAEFLSHLVSNATTLNSYMNFGLGYDYSIREYYDAIMKVVGFQGKLIIDSSKPIGMKRKLLDVTEQKRLGFTPKISLEEGLARTYEYYKKLLQNEN